MCRYRKIKQRGWHDLRPISQPLWAPVYSFLNSLISSCLLLLKGLNKGMLQTALCPSKFIHWSSGPEDPACDLIWRWALYRRGQVTTKSLGLALGFPGGVRGKRTHRPMQEMKETWVQSPGWDNPLEKGMAPHSSILAWRILWTEEPGRLQPIGSQSQTQNTTEMT